MRIASTMMDLVGNTPLVRLNRLAPAGGAEVVAKLEYFNPASSVKDRVALGMVTAAEREGRLVPGSRPPQVIVEPTSGNTGIGLAFVAAVKGYRLILAMPESMSDERKTLLRGLGATVVLTPASGGMTAAVAEAEKLVAEIPGAVMLDQFANPANPAAHYAATAEEIWADTDGTVDVFISAVGTGGTVTGVGRRLKELKLDVAVYTVEPAESPVLSGGKAGPHGIQGIGAGFVPGVLDASVYDEVIQITAEQAYATAKEIARVEGILVGISAGAAIQAAANLAKRLEFETKNIVVVIPDSGERYLSLDLFG